MKTMNIALAAVTALFTTTSAFAGGAQPAYIKTVVPVTEPIQDCKRLPIPNTKNTAFYWSPNGCNGDTNNDNDPTGGGNASNGGGASGGDNGDSGSGGDNSGNGGNGNNGGNPCGGNCGVGNGNGGGNGTGNEGNGKGKNK